MSKSIWDHPEITQELIEKSMKRARIARSKAVWEILQRLFSRPEAAKDVDVHQAAKSGLRLG